MGAAAPQSSPPALADPGAPSFELEFSRDPVASNDKKRRCVESRPPGACVSTKPAIPVRGSVGRMSMSPTGKPPSLSCSQLHRISRPAVKERRRELRSRERKPAASLEGVACGNAQRWRRSANYGGKSPTNFNNLLTIRAGRPWKRIGRHSADACRPRPAAALESRGALPDMSDRARQRALERYQPAAGVSSRTAGAAPP